MGLDSFQQIEKLVIMRLGKRGYSEELQHAISELINFDLSEGEVQQLTSRQQGNCNSYKVFILLLGLSMLLDREYKPLVKFIEKYDLGKFLFGGFRTFLEQGHKRYRSLYHVPKNEHRLWQLYRFSRGFSDFPLDPFSLYRLLQALYEVSPKLFNRFILEDKTNVAAKILLANFGIQYGDGPILDDVVGKLLLSSENSEKREIGFYFLTAKLSYQLTNWDSLVKNKEISISEFLKKCSQIGELLIPISLQQEDILFMFWAFVDAHSTILIRLNRPFSWVSKSAVLQGLDNFMNDLNQILSIKQLHSFVWILQELIKEMDIMEQIQVHRAIADKILDLAMQPHHAFKDEDVDHLKWLINLLEGQTQCHLINKIKQIQETLMISHVDELVRFQIYSKDVLWYRNLCVIKQGFDIGE